MVEMRTREMCDDEFDMNEGEFTNNIAHAQSGKMTN